MKALLALMRVVIWKTCIAIFFLALALRVAFWPSGHSEPIGSGVGAPLFILFSGMVVLSGKMKRLHVHLAWASFCISAFLPTYRLYRYHKMNSELQRDAAIRATIELEHKKDEKKKEANQ